MDNNQHYTKEYVWLKPGELTQAPEHQKMLSQAVPSPSDDSVGHPKYARINPVIAVKRKVDLGIRFDVIDGWPTVMAAQENGLEEIFVCLLEISDEADIVPIIIQLQRSKHDHLLTLYKMILALYAQYSKGQGHRSDLDENADADAPENEGLNIYQKIARALGGRKIKGNTVKWIYKIGNVNASYFERIEAGRGSLFSCYSACVNEEKGTEPEPPSVKEPVYYSSSTGAPDFSNSTSTGDVNASGGAEPDEERAVHHASSDGESREGQESGTRENSTGTDKFIEVLVTCEHCGQETVVRLKKDTLL